MVKRAPRPLRFQNPRGTMEFTIWYSLVSVLELFETGKEYTVILGNITPLMLRFIKYLYRVHCLYANNELKKLAIFTSIVRMNDTISKLYIYIYSHAGVL